MSIFPQAHMCDFFITEVTTLTGPAIISWWIVHNINMKKEQKITIIVVVLTAFITSFTGSALNLAIPDISSEFSASAARSGWIITIYTLIVAAVSIPSGRIADLKGRKRVLNLGLIIFGIASAASGLAGSLWLLIAGRGLQGIGAAMIFSTNTAILANSFPEEARGKVLGYSLAATYVGLSAGPFFGGVINHNLGWRYIFAVTAAVTAAAFILSVKGIPVAPRQVRQLIRVDIWNKAYVCSNLAALLNYGATFAVSYLLSVYLQVVLGYSSQTAGMILLVQPVIISILSPFAGKISDSVSPFVLAAIGMAVCAAGTAAGLLISVGRLQEILSSSAGMTFWIVIAMLAIVGAGSALFSSPNTNAVMSCVEKKDYSIASSTLATMRALGNTLGMLAITAASAIFIGSTELKRAQPHMIMMTMSVVFVICAAACAVGVVLALIRNRKN